MSDAGSEDGREGANLGTYEGERNARKERHGFGSTLYPNNDQYQGSYHRGKRYGKGKYTFANKLDSYEGEYVANKRHGLGVFLYKDGTSYYGKWSNNKYHGHGLYQYINGDWYAGQWKSGVKSGLGLYYFAATNTQLRGRWDTGKFVSGDWLFADGCYSGTFTDGKPSGRGVYRYKNGNAQDGEYVQTKAGQQWVVSSYSRVATNEVESSFADKDNSVFDSYRVMYTTQVFSEARKDEVWQIFQANGASSTEADIPFLDVLQAVRQHAVANWSVMGSYFDELAETLPFPSRHPSSVSSFTKFWDATQWKDDVVETFKDVVFKAERKEETAAALNAIEKDEEENVVMGQIYRKLKQLVAKWGYKVELFTAALAEVESFAEVSDETETAEPLNVDELWETINKVQVEVTRNIRVGVFDPEVDEGVDADGKGKAGPLEYLTAARREMLASRARTDEDGNIPLLELRQLLIDMAQEWFAADQRAGYIAYIDTLPYFSEPRDEETRATVLINLTDFLAFFETGSGDATAALDVQGEGDGDVEGEDGDEEYGE
eukprot:TRINITY_DN10162_c0_g1_i3.p1 TRINITY_DN10162_c0_g1~~TRINITY_DN10162_c0_g1_i3.p1  ORF type:complete len:547 (-),score=138.13 TRINITY_DN10162_c0_g1_i3:608-2248(-)